MNDANEKTAPKTALVTGAARRIGAAIARDLATHGWRVVVHCHRSVAEAEELVDALRRDEKEAAVLSADLLDANATAGLIDKARACFVPIGVLVNNASAFLPDSATSTGLGGLGHPFRPARAGAFAIGGRHLRHKPNSKPA